MSLTPGQIIDGKYRVGKLVGEGGMGSVYEGEHIRIARRVAIKVLRSEAAAKPELAARFQREARAAAKVSSKHICDVLDLGDLPNGDSYIVMEFLDGQDLDDRLKERGKMAPIDLALITYQLLDGLATMHDAGIIHRDLKPANVFLAKSSRRETVKILDFGVSKFQASEIGSTTATGAVMGTPLYMSPEQARGLKDLDGRSDLYAVGVILYKALTAELPFRGENFNEILFKIALEEPPHVEDLDPEVDPDFAAIVETAMRKEPSERYQHARDFQEAIRAWGVSRGIAFEASVSIPPPMMSGRTPQPDSEAVLPLRPRIKSTPSQDEARPSTRTAWTNKEGRTPTSVPPGSFSVTQLAAVERSPPKKLSDSLARENEKAAKRTRNIGIVAAIAVVGIVGGWLALRPSAPAPTQTVEPVVPSASASVAAQPSAAPTILELGADPPSASVNANANGTPNAGANAGANANSNGGANAGASASALPGASARPGASASSSASAAPPASAPASASAAAPPAASASSGSRWGVIPPTVPTIEKHHEPGSPAGAASGTVPAP
jgi:serine/threonine-protein kinase